MSVDPGDSHMAHDRRSPEPHDFAGKTVARFEPDADNVWRFWFTDGTAFAVQAEATSDGIAEVSLPLRLAEGAIGERGGADHGDGGGGADHKVPQPETAIVVLAGTLGAVLAMRCAFRGLERGPTWLMLCGWFGAVLCGAAAFIAVMPWLWRVMA